MDINVGNIIAIIPARGGSKGIPRKNIADICGKPLIAYAIEVALNTPEVSTVFVSTDDNEIAEIAKGLGAEVPFLRPASLADDLASPGEAMAFDLRRLVEMGVHPSAVMSLYPTHPFRNPALLSRLIGKIRHDGYREARTVRCKRVGEQTFCSMELDGRLKWVRPFGPLSKSGLFMQPDGLCEIYRTTPDWYRCMYLEKISDPMMLIDIDAPMDLELMRYVVRHNLFDFKAS